jgi:hypothetical protein
MKIATRQPRHLQDLRKLVVKSVLVDALGLDRAVAIGDDGEKDELLLTSGGKTVRLSAAGSRLYAELV